MLPEIRHTGQTLMAPIHQILNIQKNQSEQKRASTKEKKYTDKTVGQVFEKAKKSIKSNKQGNQQFKKKSVKAKQLKTQKRTTCNLENSSRISTSKCHRKLTYKHGKETKMPSSSESEDYSNAIVIETEVSLEPHLNWGWGWRRQTGLSPRVIYFTDRSKAVLLLWIFCLVFAMLCARLLYVSCGHLLGKG